MIFAARQLQEECQEMRNHLYTTFVDLTKAFDTVCWYAQGRLRPRQPPAPSPISGLLDSVMALGSSKLVLSSGHTRGNRHDRWAKPDEGLRCCVCLHTRYICSLPPTLPPLPFSLPFPLSSPLPSPIISPLLFILLPLLSSLFYSFTLTSPPTLFPLSSPFPLPPWSKKSYGEGKIQSRNWPIS
ncbi:unnamed protein product [Schistocephalus solidus]|uniref:Reverse transcriptase domain-containing protein n=1 Tax=Schistocephalus solidus TaxID=70667 RepID=A0A183TNY2_SCHSO|nr:unnamed protein product [Schistocephalus solidus]